MSYLFCDVCLVRALSIAEESYGPDHPLIGTVLTAYSDVLGKMGDKSEAKRLKKRAQDVLARHARENILGHTVDVQELETQREGLRR